MAGHHAGMLRVVLPSVVLGALASAAEAGPDLLRLRWPASPVTETSVFVGERRLDAGSWEGLSHPLQVGLQVAGRAWSAPVEVVVGYHQARAGRSEVITVPGTVPRQRTRDLEVLVQEVPVGAQVGWSWRWARLQVGGGACLLVADLSDRTTPSLAEIVASGGTARSTVRSDRTGGLGGWVAASGMLDLGRSGLGGTVRWTTGDLEVQNRHRPAGGVQVGALVLMRW